MEYEIDVTCLNEDSILYKVWSENVIWKRSVRVNCSTLTKLADFAIKYEDENILEICKRYVEIKYSLYPHIRNNLFGLIIRDKIKFVKFFADELNSCRLLENLIGNNLHIVIEKCSPRMIDEIS